MLLFFLHVFLRFFFLGVEEKAITLPETNIAPENGGFQ